MRKGGLVFWTCHSEKGDHRARPRDLMDFIAMPVGGGKETWAFLSQLSHFKGNYK